MRYSLIGAAFAAIIPSVLAFPGMEKAMTDIKARAAAPIASVEDSNELVGDLISPGPNTPVGQVSIATLNKRNTDYTQGNC